MGTTFKHKIPKELTFDAGMPVAFEEPQDGEASPIRKFHMIAYSGAPVETMLGPMIVDLAGGAIPDGSMPILRNHDEDRIVGHSESINKTSTEIIADGRLSNSTPDGIQVANTAAEGFPWQASIRFSVRKVEEIRRGSSMQVNGRSFSGPGFIVKKWELKEASFVPLGRDSNTSATVFGSVPEHALIEVERQEKTMSEQLEQLAALKEESAKAVAKAATDAIAIERARVEMIHKEFASRAEFALAQVAKGNTLEQAKVEFADVLKGENEALQVKNAELEKKLKDGGEGHPGVKFSGGALPAPGAQGDPLDLTTLLAAGKGADEIADMHWQANYRNVQKEWTSEDTYRRYLKSEAASFKNRAEEKAFFGRS